jgi:glycine cleavage system H protein
MAETYPDGLRYHPAHDWARVEDDGTATFGITWFAQDAIGEIVFVDLPQIGAAITADSAYAEVESVKAVSEVIAPLSGEVLAVNSSLPDSPEALNSDPYGEGWIARVRLTDPAEAAALLSAAAYEELLRGA